MTRQNGQDPGTSAQTVPGLPTDPVEAPQHGDSGLERPLQPDQPPSLPQPAVVGAIRRLAEVIEPLHNALEAALRRVCASADQPPPEAVTAAKAALHREHDTNPRTPGGAT